MCSFKKRKLFIGILLLMVSTVNAQIQSIGFPFIKNYTRSEYQAGLQSWAIAQTNNELIYFANNSGLMEFDGQNWSLITTPNNTLVRSVLAAKDGKIYIGSTNTFGYFSDNSSGKKIYQSLLPADTKDVKEIWKIHDTDFGIVFQSFKQIFVLQNGKVTEYKSPTALHFSFYVNKKLYVSDNKHGILEFKNGNFIPLVGTETLADKEVCEILPLNDKLLIATVNYGVFIYDGINLQNWNAPAEEYLLKNQIFCALRINNEQIAFGTIQRGVLICNNNGETNLIVDESKGLQNNTILCMKVDVNGNLWLGTDNGIDLLYINLPLTQINKYQGISAGYTAVLHDSILYLGTNRGVFYKSWNDCFSFPQRFDNFKLLENTKGQVWTLQVIDNQLFCGHNNGTFLINGNVANKISDIQGAWTFLQIPSAPDKIVAGTYNGLILFQKLNNKWQFIHKIEGFDESCRKMYFDKDQTIWMSHGAIGVFHLSLNEDFTLVKNVDLFNSKNGFNTDFNINVVKINNIIIFLSIHGIFRYNPEKKIMEKDEYWSAFFDHKFLSSLIESSNGDYWFFSEDNLNVKRIQEDGTYIDIIQPFRQLHRKFINGFEFVYPINQQNILIGYENGFIHYNPVFLKNYQKDFNAFIKKVEISKIDSNIFDGHLFSQNNILPKLEYKNNSLHFFYSAIDFENFERLQFSTFLKNYDTKWSEWETRYDREFTNLREGEYIFLVKAKNIYNVETKPVTYSFVVKPPLTRTKIAYVIYILLFIFSFILTIYIIQRRMKYLKIQEEELQRQKYIEREKELQQEALIAEKEIIRLKNEQLQAEMKTKDKELANSTMQTIQKNKFLINLKTEINQLATENKDDNVKNHIKKIIHKIDNDIENEHNWQVFETYFSNVHEEFLQRLKQQYPQLSPAELRLCACLRMNISSKEIASLLNISLRGVESSRYRLRQTLNLDRQINLTDFIISY